MALPSRTETIPEGRQDGIFTGVDLVTALRIRGANFEYVMLPGKPKFSFGTSTDCDICVERRHVSFSHALLERRGDRIRVTDLGSKNGIVFRGAKTQQFEIGAGDSFSIDETVFYLLNDEMRLNRPVVSEILAPQRVDVIDDLLMEAVRGGHVFLRAEPGSDQERLARAIHRVSLRRRHHFAIAAPGVAASPPTPQTVTHVRNGTLLLRLDGVKPDKPDTGGTKPDTKPDKPATGGTELDPAFVEALVSPDANVRVILCARSLKEAIDRTTETLASGAYRVEIPALRSRAGEIVPLLEHWFVDRQSRLRFSDLTDDNQAALRTYHWPENLEELRKAADLLIELAPYTSERQAALEGPLSLGKVKRRLDKIGLTVPLLRGPPSNDR